MMLIVVPILIALAVAIAITIIQIRQYKADKERQQQGLAPHGQEIVNVIDWTRK